MEEIKDINNINDSLQEGMTDYTKLLFGVKRNSDGALLAATEEEFDEIQDCVFMGVVIRNEDEEIDFLVDNTEEKHKFNDGYVDIPETDKRRKNYTNPVMADLNGEWMTDFLMEYHEYHDDCALCFCNDRGGWLPSGGEMSVIYKYKDEINRMMSKASGKEVSGTYWTSTQYANGYQWFVDMEKLEFGFWLAGRNILNVRAVKDASEYQETVG